MVEDVPERSGLRGLINHKRHTIHTKTRPRNGTRFVIVTTVQKVKQRANVDMPQQ